MHLMHIVCSLYDTHVRQLLGPCHISGHMHVTDKGFNVIILGCVLSLSVWHCVRHNFGIFGWWFFLNLRTLVVGKCEVECGGASILDNFINDHCIASIT